jgi:hypothetical protein
MANMIPISTVTVGSSVASMSFTGIPQTYTDLLIKVSARSDKSFGSATDITLKFNGSSSGYSDRLLYGTGSAAASASGSYTDQAYATNITQSTVTASTFSSNEIYIPNYTSANNKSLSVDGVTENNATLAYGILAATLWSNTAPITSITIQAISGNFVQYSTATLYGIRKY